jgi:hypothetical protein
MRLLNKSWQPRNEPHALYIPRVLRPFFQSCLSPILRARLRTLAGHAARHSHPLLLRMQFAKMAFPFFGPRAWLVTPDWQLDLWQYASVDVRQNSMKKEAKTFIKRILGKRKAQDRYLVGLEPESRHLFETIKARNLTYLSSSRMARLSKICDICKNIEDKTLFIEAGCALGGSAIFLAKRKPAASVLRVYDVFEMIPAPSERDNQDIHERYKIIKSGKSHGLGGEQYYGYQSNLYEKVIQTFKDFDLEPNSTDVQLIKGMVQDTLKVDLPVLLAHIDVDWFDPVTTCLERIMPNLHPEGFVFIDDYNDWSGCRNAVDEFFKAIKSEYIFDDDAGNLTIAKKSNKGMHSTIYSRRS